MAELGPRRALVRGLPRAAVTCAGCGLLCDDVLIDVSSDAFTMEPRCELGAAWFSERAVRAANAVDATIRGEPVDVQAALSRAAELLRTARRPLIYGFDGATVEDARAAVALADRLGALVTTGSVAGIWPGAPAVPLRGASTATLGEIRDRSELIVIWREDPETSHPRLLDRLGCGDDGRPATFHGDRTLVVVDDRDTATARRADTRLAWAADRDLETLTTLHVLHRDKSARSSDLDGELTGLVDRLRAVRHATFVYGAGLSAGAGGQRRALALHELVRALCHGRHVVTLELPGAAGTRSADDVLAWQTGYSRTVDLASGHPELVTATQPLASHENIDVSLRIEGAGGEQPAGVTEIALDSLPPTSGAAVEVSIRTAPAGVAATGTAHRLDGVPLALQAPLPSDAPTAAALLTRLLDEVGR
jgi:formylmethanofuran dehydrogenase subunit B